MTSTERWSRMREFQSGVTRYLIMTDRLWRGVHVGSTAPVIQYDIPNNNENYVHRIGRSGRYGRKGHSIIFVRDEDEQTLKDIENFYYTQIQELPMDPQFGDW